ncbi:nuclear envelope integral membrane protein isoform X2 [Macrobrachium rosenbergii]|uniref:nuclear envelope integral membrane protein isoform X2 n=1 Tax=Macrobrachium rosenbergii TaxID=79674 RepID=UPI0034D657F6
MAVTTNSLIRFWARKIAFYFLIFICVGTCLSAEGDDNIPGIDITEGIAQENKVKSQKAEHSASTNGKDYYEMQAGRDKFFRANGQKKLHIFCYNGEPKTVATLFKTVQFNLHIEKDNFFHYEGPNSTVIREEQKAGFWLSFYPWRSKTFKVDLYKPSCVGIETNQDFTISLRVRWVDFWRVVLMAGAVLLFFAASHLAKNIFFHYTTGIAIGILGSLIIIIMYIRKFIPTKSAAFSVMVGGWGLFIYLVQYVWQNFVELIKEYQAVAIGYVIVAGLISFAVVYRCGPLTDQRSVNLVQWAMQLISLVAVFFSSQYREATLGLIIIMVSYNSIPSKWKAKAHTYWRRRFPPKIRRLTEEEYIQQGNVETRKALDELREYCRSPNCNAWKTVSRLKTPTRFVEFVGNPRKRQSFTPKYNQRKRFAEFVEGGSHLDDDAILAYESNHVTPVRDEDDLYLTTDDEEES